jgi:Histidine kinase-, DNA gyrase B-, and HSP90-like ATPase
MELSTATLYAPPGRATPVEVERQGGAFRENSVLCSVLDAMPELVMVLNRERQIVHGNRALAEFAAARNLPSFVGLRPGELLACEHGLAAPGGCGTGEACSACGAIESILAALAGDKACHECRILRETSEGIGALDLKVWGTPFHWQGEQFAIVVAVDISNDKRRQVLEHIFFHDLLNTAGAIHSLTELLVDGVLSLDDVKDDLRETARTLVSEIRSQRELLAAENNELKVNMTPLLARMILERVVKTYENHPVARDKQIVIDENYGSFAFVSDERLLIRVLGNLLKNALEASSPGQQVTLGCTAAAGEISFWCRNEGFIPQPVRLQIFQRSFSTKEPGRGIGTYSVRLLTERYLKGRVGLISTLDEGTVFTVTLPLVYPPQ